MVLLSVCMVLAGSVVVNPALAVNAPHAGVVSRNPADWTPHVMNGSVDAIVQVGNKIIAGGTFTTVRQTLSGSDITRNHLFAFDATTGVIDSGFNPNLNGDVNSLDTDGTYVYAGGSFSTVGGQTARKVARLTAAGVLVPGLPSPSAKVNEVIVRGNRLYLGGTFTTVSGLSRVACAARA